MSEPGHAGDDLEPVEEFRERAGAWVRDNLRPADIEAVLALGRGTLTEEEEVAAVAYDRQLQRKLFDAGFAGVAVPTEYGGQGLTPAHQQALREVMAGYEYPYRNQVPTMTPCLAVLLDFGTEAQKRAHVPAILRGDELWMQLLSEPSGGSDAAGALTSAVRDGEEWVLNGSKVWTTGAWYSDWGLCLARTNWDVPKHRGLTVFILPLRQEGIEIHRIEMLNGSREFCQEFLTDVRVPDTDRIGEVDDGWTVGTRWMFHERMLFNSPLVTLPVGAYRSMEATSVLEVARDAGRLDDPIARELIGEVNMLNLVGTCLEERLTQAVRTGALSDQGAAIGRLFKGELGIRARTIGFEIAGGDGAVWGDGDGTGIDFLIRQAGAIGGGTTEMARNVIAERVLGMPREPSSDRNIAFRDVPRGPTSATRRSAPE